ncbi:MAG: Ada metal-binding domain-containing protein [Bacteroidota bacterium]
MIHHCTLSKIALSRKIRRKEIILAGNKQLKIFGTLQCSSGKRMKRKNRVFFSSIAEAKAYSFRPCGHCMRTAYNQWKDEII